MKVRHFSNCSDSSIADPPFLIWVNWHLLPITLYIYPFCIYNTYIESKHKKGKIMNQAQKTKAAQMLEFFTADLIAQGMSQEDAFNRALEAVNRLIKAA